MNAGRPTVVAVLGNRPQFIKHAALQRAWRNLGEPVRLVTVDTGQHYDYELAGIFMDELEMGAPDVSLQVGSASHAEHLARMLPGLEQVVRDEHAAVVVVYGDTNSTLAGALAAHSAGVPVAHVEAGLRSFDRTMPEEVNRTLTDRLASQLFCPTGVARDNLQAEGIVDGVEIVGDVMTDIALLMAEPSERAWRTWADQGLEDRGYAMVTIHRAANTEEDALGQLVEALVSLPAPAVFPVHPRTEAALTRYGMHVELAAAPHVTLLPPVGYLDATALLRHARCLLTDSGGMQKEAYVHGTPCVTLRDTSEWVETIEAGANVLVHTDRAAIHRETQRAFERPPSELPLAGLPPVYGTGDAAERIVASVCALAGAPACDNAPHTVGS